MIKILISLFFMQISLFAYDYTTYNSTFSASDYRTALNMGVKFFGGQRCGNTHNWMLYDNTNNAGNVCHTKDGQGAWYVDGILNNKYKGTDESGGWHDCGDFIKVAVTMGYAAVSLLTSYDVWPDAFADNYDQDYGSSDGIPDVLNEVKVATDFFMKSFPDTNTFVYYVGNGDYDHKVWATSAFQSSLSVEEGGDPRTVYATTTKGGAQAANYSSALTLMSILYSSYDAAYADKCFTYAKIAYNYAKKHQNNVSIQTYYPSPNTDWWDELGLAAALLYRKTKDQSYLDDASSYYSGHWESNAPLAWDTIADITYYYLSLADDMFDNGQHGYVTEFIKKNVFDLGIANGKLDPNGYPYFANKWGTNKLACGSAFAAALLLDLDSKGVLNLTSSEKLEAENYNRRVVDYMLGNNEFGHPFIHGFKGDMTFKVHSRNAMGVDNNPPDAEKNNIEYTFASGALIGGPQGTNDFTNDINNYVNTEGGDDYNAPFIGAISRLTSKFDPQAVKNVKKDKDISFGIYPNPFNPSTNISFTGVKKGNIKIYDINGKLIREFSNCKNLINVDFSNYSSGVYFISLVVSNKILRSKKALFLK